MHIIQTPVRFPPAVGGVESYVQELSQRLVKRDHEVTVICADTGAGERTEALSGVDVNRLWAPVSIANTNLTPGLPVRLYRQARHADLIHTHLPTPWSADISAAIGRLTDTPVVLTYHNDIVASGLLSSLARLYNQSALRVTLRLADRILLTSDNYTDQTGVLRSHREKTTTVHNGVDIERFHPTADDGHTLTDLGFDQSRPNVFFLSVLDEYHAYKGLDVLLDAMTLLADEGDPPHLVIGGDGPLREKYAQSVRDRGLAEHITFTGYISAEQLPAAYAGADVFTVPSTAATQEGFGLVALEALACETPVVTTDFIGIAADIRGSEFGRVIPPSDSQALADAIRRTLDTSPDAGPGRRLCVDSYSWTSSVEDLLAVYRQLTENST